VVALVALQRWYNISSGLWDTTGWWNSANCFTVLAALATVDPDVAAIASGIFGNTVVRAPKY